MIPKFVQKIYSYPLVKFVGHVNERLLNSCFCKEIITPIQFIRTLNGGHKNAHLYFNNRLKDYFRSTALLVFLWEWKYLLIKSAHCIGWNNSVEMGKVRLNFGSSRQGLRAPDSAFACIQSL